MPQPDDTNRAEFGDTAEPPRAGDVTLLLTALRGGDAQARDRLIQLIYGELKRIARAKVGNSNRSDSLQPTELVHESYLRLLGTATAPAWQDRAHFFAAAATAMRSILVDSARRQSALKRGGSRAPLSLEQEDVPIERAPEQIIEVDDALGQLSRVDARKGRLVELLFFGGLSFDEAASVLGISTKTVQRDWRYARAWLRGAIHDA